MRLLARLSLALIGTMIVGCVPMSRPDTGISSDVAARAAAYEAGPGLRDPSLAYAAALKANGQLGQAVAVLETAAIRNPEDKIVLAAFGKTLAEFGRARQAREVLARAHSPDQPDWTILSAEGVASDQLGDHLRAQDFYRSALAIRPDDPGILSNLGLSYALSKDLVSAENTLRQAMAQPGGEQQARHNLALVLALEGREQEAKALAGESLSPNTASRLLKQMSAQKAQVPAEPSP